MSGSVAIRITRGRVPTNCRTCQPLPAEPDDPRWVSGRDIEEHEFRLMLGSVPATREQPRLVSDRNTHVLSPAVQFNRLGFPDQPVRRRHPFRVAVPAPGCQPSGTPSAMMQQFSPRRALSTQGFLRYRRNDRRLLASWARVPRHKDVVADFTPRGACSCFQFPGSAISGVQNVR